VAVAEIEQIVQVQKLLGPDAEPGGWTEVEINAALDDGRSANYIAARWWAQRAAETAHLIDISESGTSRPLSVIHRNAKEMAATYRTLTAEEEVTPEVPASTVRRGRRSVQIKRV
jgi:hypothetical protein